MQAMADAVENSEFVILCMSDSYKRSVYCQAEAEYAFQCKRRLLPIVVRQGYRADGWLGLIIGSRIYIDYGRQEFEKACELLLKEIALQRENRSAANAIDAPPLIHTVSTVNDTLPSDYTKRDTTNSVYQRKPLEKWSRSDVLDFLFDYDLQLMMPLCESLTGHGLLKLFRISQRKPNHFFRQLNDELSTRFPGRHLPLGIFTQYLSEMDRLISSFTSPVVHAIEQDAIRSISASPSPTPSIIVTNPPQTAGSPALTTIERLCNVQIKEQAAYRTW